MQDFLVDLGQVITMCQEDEFIVEVLGIFGNISLPDLDYNRVLTQLNLLPSLMDKLKVVIYYMRIDCTSYTLVVFFEIFCFKKGSLVWSGERFWLKVGVCRGTTKHNYYGDRTMSSGRLLSYYYNSSK